MIGPRPAATPNTPRAPGVRRLALLTALFAALTVSPPGVHAAQSCEDLCAGIADGKGWGSVARKNCSKICNRERRKCDKLEQAEREDCRFDNNECLIMCADVWQKPGLRRDRSHCQYVCASCARNQINLCIDNASLPEKLRRSKVARCCGGEGQPDCCPLTLVNECCYAGRTCCASGCTDLNSDSGNCHECGHACGAGEVCSEGQCGAPVRCPTGCGAAERCCGAFPGHCVNVNTDRANCGDCGSPCAPTEMCSGGHCLDAGCAPGLILCPDLTGHYFSTCMEPDGLCCRSGISNSGPQYHGGICCQDGFDPDAVLPYPAGYVCCTDGYPHGCQGACPCN